MKPEQKTREDKLRMIADNLSQREAVRGTNEAAKADESRQAWMLEEIKRLDKELGSETNRHHLLGEALTKVLIADGVLRNGAAPSGPELLVAVDSYLESKGFVTAPEDGSCPDSNDDDSSSPTH